MDWEDLRVFAAFAETGSLSGAAKATKLDHSTVGRRIAKLEADLGVKLVDRLPRGIVPTEEGRRIAVEAAKMAEGAHAVERAARGSAKDQSVSGTVTLSLPPALAAGLVAPALTPLVARHPDLKLCLLAEAQTVNLARNDADIALRLGRPEGNSLIARRVAFMDFCLCAAEVYLQETASADWRFVGYDRGLEHLPQQRWLENFASGRPFVLRANEQAVQMAAIVAGMGIGVLPVYCADHLVRIAVEPAPPRRELWLVAHGDLLRARAVRTLFDFLAELFAAQAARLADQTA